MSNQYSWTCQHYREGSTQRVCYECTQLAAWSFVPSTSYAGTQFASQDDRRTQRYLGQQEHRRMQTGVSYSASTEFPQEHMFDSYPYPTSVDMENLPVIAASRPPQAYPGSSTLESTQTSRAGQTFSPSDASQSTPYWGSGATQSDLRNHGGDWTPRDLSANQNVRRQGSDHIILTPSATAPSSMNVSYDRTSQRQRRKHRRTNDEGKEDADDDSRR